MTARKWAEKLCGPCSCIPLAARKDWATFDPCQTCRAEYIIACAITEARAQVLDAANAKDFQEPLE